MPACAYRGIAALAPALQPGPSTPTSPGTRSSLSRRLHRDLVFRAAVVLGSDLDIVSLDLLAVLGLPAHHARDHGVSVLGAGGRLRARERLRHADNDGLAGGDDDAGAGV